MKPKSSLLDRLAEAALRCAAQQDWEDITVDQIAKTARMASKPARALLPNQAALCQAVAGLVTRDMLVAVPKVASTTQPRDALFELLMARLDALQARRPGFLALGRATRQSPQILCATLSALKPALMTTLRHAGLDATPPWSNVMGLGLTTIYLNTVRVWEKDSSPDLAATMATLDRGLTRAERVLGFLKR